MEPPRDMQLVWRKETKHMNDIPKNWYASKTVWGGILALVVPMLGLVLHLNISDAQVQEVATDLSLIGGAAAGLWAIYGRLKASAPIAGTQAAQAIQPQAKG